MQGESVRLRAQKIKSFRSSLFLKGLSGVEGAGPSPLPLGSGKIYGVRSARGELKKQSGGWSVAAIFGEGASLRETMPAKLTCPQKVRASLHPRRASPICRAMSEANEKAVRWTICHHHFGRRRKPSQNDAGKINLPAESTSIVEPSPEYSPHLFPRLQYSSPHTHISCEGFFNF